VSFEKAGVDRNYLTNSDATHRLALINQLVAMTQLASPPPPQRLHRPTGQRAHGLSSRVREISLACRRASLIYEKRSATLTPPTPYPRAFAR
jgi:hypothetical protein